jgi:hypothetical protein
VFNNPFEDIADSSKLIYLVALGLLVVSIGLLMTPAAYHRLVERGQVSRRMRQYATMPLTRLTMKLPCEL